MGHASLNGKGDLNRDNKVSFTGTGLLLLLPSPESKGYLCAEEGRVGPARGTSQNMVKNFMPLILLEERPAVGIALLLVELLIDFGGKVKRAAGEVVCIMRALVGTESVWMSWSGGMSVSLCRGEIRRKGTLIGGSRTTISNAMGMAELEKKD